jgi:hypothetical protein
LGVLNFGADGLVGRVAVLTAAKGREACIASSCRVDDSSCSAQHSEAKQQRTSLTSPYEYIQMLEFIVVGCVAACCWNHWGLCSVAVVQQDAAMAAAPYRTLVCQLRVLPNTEISYQCSRQLLVLIGGCEVRLLVRFWHKQHCSAGTESASTGPLPAWHVTSITRQTYTRR